MFVHNPIFSFQQKFISIYTGHNHTTDLQPALFPENHYT